MAQLKQFIELFDGLEALGGLRIEYLNDIVRVEFVDTKGGLLDEMWALRRELKGERIKRPAPKSSS